MGTAHLTRRVPLFSLLSRSIFSFPGSLSRACFLPLDRAPELDAQQAAASGSGYARKCAGLGISSFSGRSPGETRAVRRIRATSGPELLGRLVLSPDIDR